MRVLNIDNKTRKGIIKYAEFFTDNSSRGNSGLCFCRLGIPGGMMVGSIIAVSIWNIATGLAFMPAESKVLAQIIAGAFIGAGIEKVI